MRVGEAVEYNQQFWADIDQIPSGPIQDRYLAMAEQTPDFQEAQEAEKLLAAIGNHLGSYLSTKEVAEVTGFIAELGNKPTPNSTPDYFSKPKSPRFIETESWLSDLLIEANRPIPKNLGHRKRQQEINRKERRLEKQFSAALINEEGKPQHFIYDIEDVDVFLAFKKFLIDNSDKPLQPLIGFMDKAFVKEMRQNWKQVSPNTLAHWIRLHAEGVEGVMTSADSSSDPGSVHTVTSHALEAYFMAPSSAEERVEAMYKFLDATYMLVEEGELTAFKAAVRILNFDYDSVLSYYSTYQMDFTAMQAFGFHDLEVFEKAKQIDAAKSCLWSVAFPGEQYPFQKYIDRPYINTDSYHKRLAAIRAQAESMLGKQTVSKMRQELDYHLENTFKQITKIAAAGQDLGLPRWLADISIYSQDRLARKYDQLIGSLGRIAMDIDMISQEEDGYRGGYMSIPVDAQHMIDVFVPSTVSDFHLESLGEVIIELFKEKREEVISKSSFTQIEAANLCHVYPVANFSVGVDKVFDDSNYRIRAQYRKRVTYDDLVNHPLYELAYDGLPEPLLEGDKSLVQSVEQLAETIRTQANRFVGKRGIKFSISEPSLANAGVESIVCRRAETAGSIDVTFRYKGKDLKFSLDNYALTPGKALASFTQATRAIHLVLSLLNEWMTKPAVHTSEGTVEEGREAPAGVGYFSYLRVRSDGYKYQRQPEQWYACVEEQDLDLDEVSARRAEQDKTGKKRNSTYYKERYDDRTDKEPLIVYVDQPRYQ